LNSIGKMASRDLNATQSLLHLDTGASKYGDVEYKVTVQNGRAQIEVSENVGLVGPAPEDNGLNNIFGLAKYTLKFDCDLGNPPQIESLHLKQQLIPVN
ncbi:MAG: hypothetical protein IJS50_04460, partial [Desulfovibrio sp.]|nr:hypothetical protein [Desulfovibrio sp.]